MVEVLAPPKPTEVLHSSHPEDTFASTSHSDDIEFDQIQVQDWDEEADKDEAAKEEELIRVQQKIERLRQEQ
jgi:hypothetical protein